MASNVENQDAVYSLAKMPISKHDVELEIWPPQYPSLAQLQSQENSLMSPILPTAPYLEPVVFEAVLYPKPIRNPYAPYYCKSMPIKLEDDVKPLSNQNSTNTSRIDKNKIARVIQKDESDGTIIAPQKSRLSQICCSKIFWLIVVFFLLLAVLVVLMYQIYVWYMQFRMQQRMELDRSRFSHHNYYN